jgi:hypothetical protein
MHSFVELLPRYVLEVGADRYGRYARHGGTVMPADLVYTMYLCHGFAVVVKLKVNFEMCLVPFRWMHLVIALE